MSALPGVPAALRPSRQGPEHTQGRVQRLPAMGATYLLFAVMAGTTAPNALWPLFQDRLGISTAAVTLVFASYAAAVVATLVVMGAASDTIGRRPVLAAAVGVGATASLVTLSGSLGGLVAGRVLAGVSVGLVSGAAVAYITELAPGGGERGALVATAATMGGLAAGPLIAGLVAEVGTHPTRAPFVAHLVLLVPALLALRGPETVRRRSGATRRPQRLAVPAARVPFTGAALAGFAANAQLGLYSALAASLLFESLDVDSILISGLTGALLFAVAGTSQLTTSAMSARARLQVSTGLLGSGTILLTVALGSGSLPLFLAAVTVGGAGGGLGFSAGLSMAGSLAGPNQRGAVSSTWFVATYLGLVGPVIGAGYLVDAVGPRNAAGAFGVGITILAIGSTILTRALAANPRDN